MFGSLPILTRRGTAVNGRRESFKSKSAKAKFTNTGNTLGFIFKNSKKVVLSSTSIGMYAIYIHRILKNQFEFFFFNKKYESNHFLNFSCLL